MTTTTMMARTAGGDEPRRPSRGLVLSLVGGIVAVAAVGYWQTGTPNHAALESQARQAAAGGAGRADAAQLETMVARLAEHLASRPDDGEGWAMLGRARGMQGRLDDALAAYRKAVALRPDDARLLTDFAQTLAARHGNTFGGEPTVLLARALALEPNAPKALALSGSAAFERRDFASAVAHWERLLKVSPPDADFVPQVQAGIARARQQGGLPAQAASPATPAAPATAAADPTAPTAPGVSGTVVLADALKARAAPDDTVFVYARAADGPRMPLALLRVKAKDLPLEFSLDDSRAMSPQARLSSASRVVVVARVTKSGQAAPEPGDLTGQSEPVSLGSRGLRVVIDDVVR